MKTINKSYKCRLYPSEQQKILLNKHFNSCRFVYNHFLYLSHNTNIKLFSHKNNCEELTKLKKQKKYKWLNETNAQSLQRSLKNLDTAYSLYFKNEKRIPKYKPKQSRQSFHVPQGIKFVKNKLSIAKFREGIPIYLHKQIEGDICFVTITKTPTEKYYASITVEIPQTPYPKTGLSIGIDTGIKTLAVLSDGTVYENIKSLNKDFKKLKFNRKQFLKKKKDSNSREKQRIKLTRIHENIADRRKDHLQKITTEIVKKYDIICIEDLDIKDMLMINDYNIKKSLFDAAIGTFYRMLEYKAKWNDKKIIKIDQWFPSSKTCNSCGFINYNLTLKDREWVCPNCGMEHERDFNASKNILKEGLRILNQNCVSGIEAQDKQKQVEALSIGKSKKPDINQSKI